MKRIIHLSDIHVGYKDFDQRFRAVVSNLIAEKGVEAKDHVLLITGDLVNDANISGIYNKVSDGLEDLRRAGFEHILIAPGNHDYGTGDMGNKKFVKEFQVVFYGKEVVFPKKDLIDGTAFIGMDSMAAELHWHDRIWAEGEFGKAQLGRLAAMLREDDVRACRRRVIYFHHHPFKWRPLHQLKDAQAFRRVLEAAGQDGIVIDALLFGHNHQGNAHNGGWGISRCYDAGTVTLKPRPDWVNWFPWFKIKSSVRVIDLEDDAQNDHILRLFK